MLNVGDKKVWAISDIEGNLQRLLYFLINIGAINLKGWDIDEEKESSTLTQEFFTADFEINPDFKDHIVINGDICSGRHEYNYQVVDVLTRLKKTALADNIHIVIGNHEAIGVDGEQHRGNDPELQAEKECIKRAKIKMLTSKDIHGRAIMQPELSLGTKDKKWLFRHGFNPYDGTKEYKCKVYKAMKDYHKLQGKTYKDCTFARIDSFDKTKNDEYRKCGYGFFEHDKVRRWMIGFREKHGQNAIYCMGHDKQKNEVIRKYAESYGIACLDNIDEDYFCITGDNLAKIDLKTGKLKTNMIMNSKNPSFKRSNISYKKHNINNKQAKNVKKQKHISV